MDVQKPATGPQFGDVYKQIQTKYGEKTAKPREIKKTLGKDDFLRIMITQMKNQDPSSPFKAEQMAAEIAQFTSVEQLQNVNQNLSKMANQNRPVEQMAMTHLIGKTVTMDRQRFPHTENEGDFLSFHLPKKAKEVNVSIVNEVGEEIYRNEMGSQGAGEVTFSWDGIKSNGLPSKSGNFQIKVEAKDEKDLSLEINSIAKAKIIGVSFEGSEAVFLVGDSAHQEKITMKNIIRVEMDQDLSNKKDLTHSTSPLHAHSQLSMTSAPKSESAITPVVDSNSNKNNFISFKKGEGSSNLDGEGSKILEQVMKNEEKGFPNGLNPEGEMK